jgi:hypothetical protein
MGVALEMACLVRTGGCTDDVKEAIANKIIALAKAGERDSDALCEHGIEGYSHRARLGAPPPKLFDCRHCQILLRLHVAASPIR